VPAIGRLLGQDLADEGGRPVLRLADRHDDRFGRARAHAGDQIGQSLEGVIGQQVEAGIQHAADFTQKL
jgi:hypothetical protein